MIQKIFSVYDCKAEAYLQPFFSPTKGLAMRAFIAAVNKVGHDFNTYANDYSLWEIGEWDESKGTLSTHEIKMPLGGAHEFLSQQNNQLNNNRLEAIQETEITPRPQQ